MQKHIFLWPVLILSTMAGCSQSPKQPSSEGEKILVVYYSWGGNTREVARQIQEATHADLFEIIPERAYPAEYKACTEQAKMEIESGIRPPLKTKMENIEQYDKIFVGTPNWWSTMAPPVATFLAEHQLSGKTVIPFCTHGGGGKARCFSDMEKLASESTILEGIAISGEQAKSSRSNIDQWLREIKIIK